MRGMKHLALVLTLVAAAETVHAGPASGVVKSKTGVIQPKHAIAYVVRDARNARTTHVEVLLTDVPVEAASLRGELDPHMTAINLEALRDRNYLLLWVAPDGTVSMNATYSETMTQYMNDSAGGLTSAFAANTPTRVDGRVFAKAPLKTMNGDTYSIDVTFSAEVVPAVTGAPLPAGGAEAGQALTALVRAVGKKDWNGIKAGLAPDAVPMFDKSYNTPAENAASAADLFAAWLPLEKLKVSGGMLVNPTTAVLYVEGVRFGSGWMSIVRMVKTGPAWQFAESVPGGMLR